MANFGPHGGVQRAPNTTTLAAADYDNGGESVGYHSVTTGNFLPGSGAPGVYRNDNVSIENTSDVAAGHQPYDITYIYNGEWFAYTVFYGFNPGTLTPTLRVNNVAAPDNGDTSAEADLIIYGNDATSQVDRISLPVSSSWQSVTGPSFTMAGGVDRIVMEIASGSYTFESISFAQVASPALTAPTLLSATPGASGSIGLTWTPVVAATGYKIHWGTSPGTDAAGSPATLSSYDSRNYSIGSLTAGTTYFITVVATNAANPNGNASTSNQLSATTQAAGMTVPLNYSTGFSGSPLTASAGYDRDDQPGLQRPGTRYTIHQLRHAG